MTRFRASANTRSRTGVMSRSGVVKPGTSALVESASSRSTPSSPSRANARRSVSRPSSGQLVHLEVAGVQHQPGRGADRDRQRVRDRVVDRDELALEGPDLLALPLAHLERVGRDPVLLQLGLDHRQGQPGADQRDVGTLPQQVGDGADVVLVGVGEHDAVDPVEPVPDVVEVGEDQVDAGLVVLGEEHPAVDDEQPAVVLEDRHVAADLAETAEGDDAQAALRERRRGAELGVRVAHEAARTAARAVASRVTSSSRGGQQRRSYGALGDQAGRLQRGLGPDRPLRGLVHDRADGRDQPAVDRERAGQVAPVDGGHHRGVVGAVQVPDHADDAGRAVGQPGEVHRVVAGVVGEAGLRHHPGALEEVALGVLDREDPLVLGEARPASRTRSGCRCGPGCRRGSPGGRPASAAARKCAHQRGLRAACCSTGVTTRQPVGAGLLGRPGELDRVVGVVGAGAGDHPGAVAHRLDDGADQPLLLVVAGRRRLPGRPADHQAVVAVVDEVGGEAPGPRRGRATRRRGTG